MNAIFLSDVHLTDPKSLKTQLVLRFFLEKAALFDRIFILGDLFESWPATTSFLIEKYTPVLEVLKKLVKEGHEIHYLEGNHDFHLGNYFSQSLGIKTHPEHLELELGDKKCFLAHGDLGNTKDMKYRVLRKFLRSTLIKRLILQLPSSWVHQLGVNAAKLSKDFQSKRKRNESAIRQTYRETAELLFQKGFDVVLMGHTHLPDDVSTVVAGRPCRYLNTGDWVSHFTYVEFDGSQFYTKTHPVKGF